MHTTTQTPENRLEGEGQTAKAGLSQGTLLASIVAGIAASTCCLGPLVLWWKPPAPPVDRRLAGHRHRAGGLSFPSAALNGDPGSR